MTTAFALLARARPSLYATTLFLMLGAAAIVPAATSQPMDARLVVDLPDDHAVNPIDKGAIMPSPVLDAADLWWFWIDGETDAVIQMHLMVQDIPFMPMISRVYEIHFVSKGRPYVAEIVGRDYMSWPVYKGRGVAQDEAVTVEGDTFTFRVQKDRIGNPRAGDLLSSLYVTSAIGPLVENLVLVSDRAPDDGYGRDYKFVGGKAPAAKAPDPHLCPPGTPEPADVAENQDFTSADEVPQSPTPRAEAPGPAFAWLLAALAIIVRRRPRPE